MKTYRLGVAALVHDHVWGELRHWKGMPNVEIVAAGDVNPPLRERLDAAAKEAGASVRLYPSWQEMLDAEGDGLDIVQVASENSVHADVVEACAARGLHVISEKPMAATYAQAKRMRDAAAKAGTLLMINWPTAWSPAFQEMERRILAGDIGTVRYFKYRSAHNGPKELGCDPHFYSWLYDAEKNGAGALMDYCCYGAAMCARFLGRPAKVTGLRGVLAKDYPVPDDAAIIAMQYPHAFGVAEASWVQPTGYATANPVAYGSEGAISLLGGKVQLFKPGKSAPEEITPPPTAAPLRSGPEYLIHCLENGAPIEGVCSPEVSLIGQEILQAGLQAADTGSTQTLPL
jgi:predicted dehydrogenase